MSWKSWTFWSLLLAFVSAEKSREAGVVAILDPKDFPFLVSIEGSAGNCVGTLVHPDIVLTTAHCQGSNRLFVGGASVRASVQVPHLLFAFPEYDFLIWKLDESFPDFLSINRDIHLWAEHSDLVLNGYSGRTTGEPVLVKVTLQLVSDAECDAFFQADLNEQVIFCTDELAGKIECDGNSGAPLVGGNNLLVGILSFGRSDCTGPTGFARVAAVASWIDHQVCCLSSRPPSGCTCPDEESQGCSSDTTNDMSEKWHLLTG